MKLIDLLVKELPSRGGWPEGVIKFSQDYDGELWAWKSHNDNDVKSFCKIDSVCEDHRVEGSRRDYFATREQYEAAITPRLISTGLHSASHAQFCAAGWTDEQLIEYGYFRVGLPGEKPSELPGLSCERIPSAACAHFSPENKNPYRKTAPVHPAHSFLEKGVQHMKDRAAQRDSEGGERSMKACVDAFNAIFGHNLTETQGWQFMVLLKMARGRNKFNPDDYEDGAAYTGLAGEAHSHEQK